MEFPRAPHLQGAVIVVTSFFIRHPDGPILLDTGFALGHAKAETLFHPVVRDFDDALREMGVKPSEVRAIANCHLHIDHSGNNWRFPGTPIFIQKAERDAARTTLDYSLPKKTIDFPGAMLEVLNGEEAEIARGVRIIPTPGHTDGHQSFVVDTQEGESSSPAKPSTRRAITRARSSRGGSIARVSRIRRTPRGSRAFRSLTPGGWCSPTTSRSGNAACDARVRDHRTLTSERTWSRKGRGHSACERDAAMIARSARHAPARISSGRAAVRAARSTSVRATLVGDDAGGSAYLMSLSTSRRSGGTSCQMRSRATARCTEK